MHSVAQIPLLLSCRRHVADKFWADKSPRLVGKMFPTKKRICCTSMEIDLAGMRQVSDYKSQTCAKPGFKQVLSKIEVMEFGHNELKGWAWEPGNPSYLFFAAILHTASWSHGLYASASYVLLGAILRRVFFEKPGKCTINLTKSWLVAKNFVFPVKNFVFPVQHRSW